MREAMIILGAVGVGAAVMYLLDPDRGNQRRALLRDKAAKLNRQTLETVSGKIQDVTNRTKGMLHEAKSAFTSEDSGTREPTGAIG